MWARKENQAAPAPMLYTSDLFLRPAVADDYEQWKSVRGRNQAFLKPFEPAWPDACLERDFFLRRVERLKRERVADHCHAFLVFTKQGTLVGGINLNNVSRGAAQMASLGYWLDEEMQGRGLMTQAGGAILGHGFHALGLARINAATLVHNQRSKNMLLRLGFSEEGFARAYIQIDGRRQDHVLYGLNAADFSGAPRDA